MDKTTPKYEFLDHLVTEKPIWKSDDVVLSNPQMKAILSKHRRTLPIYFGEGYYLSIQASEYHYCEPRVTLKRIEDYSAYEVALLHVDGGFRKISEVVDWEGLDESDNVYGFMPKEVVEIAFQKMKEKYGLVLQEVL